MTARSADGCTHPPTWLTKPLQALNPEWLCSILEKDADLSLGTSTTSHLISIYLVPGSKILLQQEAEPSNRVTEGEDLPWRHSAVSTCWCLCALRRLVAAPSRGCRRWVFRRPFGLSAEGVASNALPNNG